MHNEFKTLKDRIKYVEERNARKIEEIKSKFEHNNDEDSVSNSENKTDNEEFIQEEIYEAERIKMNEGRKISEMRRVLNQSEILVGKSKRHISQTP